MYRIMRPPSLSAGFIPPCLPSKAPALPSGTMWLHEIKHDRFRVIARKDGPRVKLYSRPGNDLTKRFPPIAEALARLCAILPHRRRGGRCDERGLAPSTASSPPARGSLFLYAFDLVEA